MGEPIQNQPRYKRCIHLTLVYLLLIIYYIGDFLIKSFKPKNYDYIHIWV